MTVYAAGRAVGVFGVGSPGRRDVGRPGHAVAYVTRNFGCPLAPVADHGAVDLRPSQHGLLRRPPRVPVVSCEPLTVADGPQATWHAVQVAAEEISGALAARVTAPRSPGGVGRGDADVPARSEQGSAR
jgi:hypothetical protein